MGSFFFLILAILYNGIKADKYGPELQNFVTEPDFTALKIHILHNSALDALAEGAIFLSPYIGGTGWGPQIFDSHGELIWFGGHAVRTRAMDLQPCLYNTTLRDHLCYNDALPVEQGGHSSGVIRMFDNTYTQVGRDFTGAGNLRGPDIHELNTPPSQSGKTLLQDIYQVRSKNLSQYGGPEDGYILDSCFQEIDVLSRQIVFQWCSLDYVDIDTTYVYVAGSGRYTIPGLAGDGSKNAPWDWLHINSIDKNVAGDYLISSRHANAIFHVAGFDNKQANRPGQVIWYLGGKRNSFSMTGGLNFSAQHTIRFHEIYNETKMRVILFDNASEGRTITANASSGMIIELDTRLMRASLISQFVQPHGLIAEDQGNLQILANGNAFLGWGHCNYFSEHAPTGETLYYAQFGGKSDCDEGIDAQSATNYRAWKFPWKGHPISSPKLVAYAYSCEHRIYAYASWNGATEVASWAFYASNHTSDVEVAEHLKHVATVPKSGFETQVELDFALLLSVTPLDSEGNPLAGKTVIETFVPRAGLDCGLRRCRNASDHRMSNSIKRSCAAAVWDSERKDVPKSLDSPLAQVVFSY